jgi:hypothetical protein
LHFVAYEGLDRQIVERLRQVGHTVLYVAEMEPGQSDDIILEQANRADALLATADASLSVSPEAIARAADFLDVAEIDVCGAWLNLDLCRPG